MAGGGSLRDPGRNGQLAGVRDSPAPARGLLRSHLKHVHPISYAGVQGAHTRSHVLGLVPAGAAVTGLPVADPQEVDVPRSQRGQVPLLPAVQVPDRHPHDHDLNIALPGIRPPRSRAGVTAVCSLVGGVDAAGRFATCGYPVLAPQSKCKPLSDVAVLCHDSHFRWTTARSRRSWSSLPERRSSAGGGPRALRCTHARPE
jgi:hypothetical protein